MWLPKSTHFSYQGMITCSQLAAIDLNLCSELTQAETKLGVKHFSVTYSKATNNWSGKPMKEKEDRSVFKNLVSCVDEVVANGQHFTPLIQKGLSPFSLFCEKTKKHLIYFSSIS